MRRGGRRRGDIFTATTKREKQMNRRNFLYALAITYVTLFAALSLACCGGVLEDVGRAVGLDVGGGAAPLTGNNAFLYFRRNLTRTYQPDTNSILKIIANKAEGGSSTASAGQFEPGQSVINILRKNARTRGTVVMVGEVPVRLPVAVAVTVVAVPARVWVVSVA